MCGKKSGPAMTWPKETSDQIAPFTACLTCKRLESSRKAFRITSINNHGITQDALGNVKLGKRRRNKSDMLVIPIEPCERSRRWHWMLGEKKQLVSIL